MLIIGSYNELVVEREVDFGFYLNPKEDEVLLPAKYAPQGLKPGDTIRVFVYTDSEDRPIATTLTPLVAVGDYAVLTVKDVEDFGVFLDWGLEKDLLLPKSEMPKPLNPGDRVVVRACLDAATNRVYATANLSRFIEDKLEGLAPGDQVDLLIYGISDLGIQALINKRYTGMLFHNETFENLVVGDKTIGYIHHIKEDGKIDLLLKRPGYDSVQDSSTKVLEQLKQANGFIPINDKSTPKAIKEQFAMSKKEYKRTIGGLYKSRIIDINAEGIRLLEAPDKGPVDETPPAPTPWEMATKKSH